MRGDRHRGRVAIVTGAGQGTGRIGREIALRLAGQGAAIMVADIDPKVQETAEEIAAVTGAETMHHAGNLAEEAVVAAMVARAAARWGRIDILVNNAGGGIIRPFLEHTADTLVETVARNLWTAVWCCHKVLPHMVERRYGRIVNIGADSVRSGIWGHAGYNAAKGGVHAMTAGLAREFAAYDITINTVAPCVVATERFGALQKDKPEIARQFLDVVPKGRGAELAEIAGFVDYLAGAEAGFTTGQTLSVNGGSTMP
jgi:2,3-dihydroxy-2,3-dihydro-p-cumate dehydrogenase